MSTIKLTKAALGILRIPPANRSSSDIDTLAKATSHIKFFVRLTGRNSQLHIGCCKVMTSLRCNRQDYVFHFRDEGDAFYIILEGKVQVLVPDKTPRSITEESVEEESSIAPGFAPVGEIETGGSFGELALINDKPRSASILCLEPCVFAVLSRKDFELVKQTQEQLIEDRIDFLKTIPLFSSWARSSLQAFCLNFEEVNLRKGHFLFKEGDPANFIYMIRSGNLKIIQQYDFKPFEESAKLAGKEFRARKHHFRYNSESFRRTDLQISAKGKGDLFGFEEMIGKKTQREMSCICLTDVSAYVVSTKEFFSKLTNPEDRKILESNGKIINQWNRGRVRKLRKIEMYKHEASHTDLPLLKKSSPSPASLPPLNYRLMENYTPIRHLPSIMTKLMQPSFTSNEGKIGITPRESRLNLNNTNPQQDFLMFDTEVPNSVRQTNLSTDRRVSLKNYHTPSRLSPMNFKQRLKSEFRKYNIL